jgi:hypothetical protein
VKLNHLMDIVHFLVHPMGSQNRRLFVLFKSVTTIRAGGVEEGPLKGRGRALLVIADFRLEVRNS